MTQRCRKAHQYLREYYKRFKQIQGAVGSSQAHSMWDTSDFDANQMSDEGESSEESEDEEWTEEVKKKKGKKEKEVPLTQAPKVDDSKRKPFHAEDIHETSKTSARPPPRRSLPPTLVPSRALRLPHASHLPPQLVSPKGHSLALLKTSPPSVSSSSSEVLLLIPLSYSSSLIPLILLQIYSSLILRHFILHNSLSICFLFMSSADESKLNHW